MDKEAQSFVDQLFKEQHEQLMKEIERLEQKKWDAIRRKMFRWLSDNGYLPKN